MTRSFDPETLDAPLDAAWMRRLARSLVDDPLVAEDVARGASALGGPSARRGRLALLVRSLAHRHRRSEQRRRARERLAARPDEVPSTADVAARSDAVRAVARALHRLEEPYRTTLVLRYFDDVPATEIALRQGVPAATVRSRVKRGLARLRDALDARPGGRERWVSALLPFVTTVPPWAPSGFTPTRDAMRTAGSLTPFTTVMKLASVAALAPVVAGLGIAVWVLAPSGERVPTPPGVAGADAGPTVAPQERPVSPATAASRSARRDAAPGSEIAERAASTTTRSRVVARALDAGGAPLAGAWLELELPPAHNARGQRDGTLALELDAAELRRLSEASGQRGVAVRVGAAGWRTELVHRYPSEPGPDLLVGDVRLAPGGVVTGRVVDPAGQGIEDAVVVFGAPVAAALTDAREHLSRHGPRELQDTPLSSGGPPAVLARSGPGGAFRLDGVPSGHGVVWARAGLSLWASSEPIGLREHEEHHGVELVLRDAPEASLSGTVVDPDGRPVAGVDLVLQGDDTSVWSQGRSDARGRFFFAPADDEPLSVRASPPAWDWETLEVGDVARGMHDLVLAFERSAWFQARVRGADGEALRDGDVELLPPHGPTTWPLPRTRSELGEGGLALVRRPTGPFRLRARAPGHREALLGPFDPAELASPLEVVLETVPAIVGRVTRRDGSPAAGARVSLHRVPRPRDGSGVAHVSHQGWGGDRDAFVYACYVEPTEAVTTDDTGAFRLTLPGVDATARGDTGPPEAGRGLAALGYVQGASATRAGGRGAAERAWYVQAVLPGHASVASGPHRFDATGDARLDLELREGGAILGRLVLRDDDSTAGWRMIASDGLARVVDVPVTTGDAFRFEGLHPGAWQVRALEPGQRYHPGNLLTSRAPIPDVEVVAGRTVEHEHVTGRRIDARLTGRLTVDGRPPGPTRVEVRTATPEAAIRSHVAQLDPDGRFELELASGLRTHLFLSVPGGENELTIAAEPKILPGDNAWSLDLETARIEGRFAPPDEEPHWFAPRAQYVGETGAGVEVRVLFHADEDGRFGPVRVPAGRGEVRGAARDFRSPPLVLAELVLEPEERRRIELR